MKFIQLLAVLLLISLGISTTQVSDIQVSKGEIVVDGDQAFIEFKVSWKLSWHNAMNWDAAWVFAKDPSRGFQHVTLPHASGEFLRKHLNDQPDPGFDVSDEHLGVFIYREQQRSERGPNNWTVRLESDYTNTGQLGGLDGKVSIRRSSAGVRSIFNFRRFESSNHYLAG